MCEKGYYNAQDAIMENVGKPEVVVNNAKHLSLCNNKRHAHKKKQ